jgi:hypothetical protein
MSMIGPASRRGDKVVGRLQSDASAQAFFDKAWRQPEQQKPTLGTGMDAKTAGHLVSQFGDRGSLPKGLSRDDKKAAYEARWVHSGGQKKAKWQRRSEVANAVTTGALAGGGLSAGVELASRTKRGSAALDRLGNTAKRPVMRRVNAASVRRVAGHAGLASAALGASSELYRRRAAGKAKTYTSAPGGVAAGALRRMESYDRKDG